MTIQELENLARPNFYLHQLFCLKRCFGPRATINFVGEQPLQTIRCRTIEDLSKEVEVSPELLELDPYFSVIPPIAGPDSILDDLTVLIPDRFNDGGPRSPLDIRLQEQEVARRRCQIKRQLIKQIGIGSFDWQI